MGTYLRVECQKKASDDKYEEVDIRIDWPQSYALFGWLAGVRNYSGVEPVKHTQGFPQDMQSEEDKDRYWSESVYWIDTADLFAVDYDALVEDRRVTKQTGPRTFDGGATCDKGEGKQMPLHKFLGPEFMKDLQRFKDIGIDRLILAFN